VIRVVVADDHAVVRTGLAQVIANSPELEVVGVAANGREAADRCAELQPDVVLMDLSMPVMDGIDATRAIQVTSPKTSIVVLTSFSDRQRILAALDAGATGYLLKDAEPEAIVDGIHAAARGEAPLDPKVGRTLLTARALERPAEALTQREREVLELVAGGLPNKVIARRLSISEKTVKAHLTSIFRQLGVDDRMQAALWAREHGLVPGEPR
jgi:DNA-binding NarL/FixJ family response regulator